MLNPSRPTTQVDANQARALLSQATPEERAEYQRLLDDVMEASAALQTCEGAYLMADGWLSQFWNELRKKYAKPAAKSPSYTGEGPHKSRLLAAEAPADEAEAVPQRAAALHAVPTIRGEEP